MSGKLLPPSLLRADSDLDRRVSLLERRTRPGPVPASRPSPSALVTVAAANTPRILAAQATFRCDGTDDQEEIQAAVDLATSGNRGGIVIFLPGFYSTSASVAPRNGVRLVGGADVDINYSGVGYAFDCDFGHGAVLDHLTVYADGLGAGCFRSQLGERIVELNHCRLTAANGTDARPAVWLSGQNASVVACTIEASGAWGIYIQSGSIYRAWIAGNCITNSNIGIQVDGAHHTRVVANWVNATSHGIRVYAGANYTVVAANVIQAGGDGIIVEGADHTSIQGNTVVSAGGWGIHIADAFADRTSWTDNHIVAATSGDFNDVGTGTIGNGGIPDFSSLTEADIPPEIARDTEVTGAITTHEGAADPHLGYQKESEKGVANGYAGLDAEAQVATAQLATGTADATTFLRGDQTWATPAGGSTDVTDAFVPYYLASGETFTVPQYRQALFIEPIDLDGGTLDVEGLLVEVSQPPDLSALVHMGVC